MSGSKPISSVLPKDHPPDPEAGAAAGDCNATQKECAREQARSPTIPQRPPASQSSIRPVRVALAFPGGFEFGGIGRMMLYATQSWGSMPGAPIWTMIDARGSGSLGLMPLHLAAAIALLSAGRLLGRFDLLHLNVAGRGSTLRKIVLSEVARLLDLPTVVHLHDCDYERDLKGRSAFVRRLIVRMFRQARRVIVLGERDSRTVEDALYVPPSRVVRLANAVPDPGEPPGRGGRPGPVRLLFLGHLDNRKGVPELLQALTLPALRERAWHIDLAGGGETRRFRAEARDLGLTDRATFHGWLSHDKTAALCRNADIFVLPSHAEGQAVSLLEAMAHGMAIVTTPVGAHLEAVSPGREAIILQPGDIERLASELARLIEDPALRARLGAAARRRFLEAFNINGYAAKLATFYTTMAEESRGSSRQRSFAWS
jgi:glycosyltransferase involved in cell wall biosynthesis